MHFEIIRGEDRNAIEIDMMCAGAELLEAKRGQLTLASEQFDILVFTDGLGRRNIGRRCRRDRD